MARFDATVSRIENIRRSFLITFDRFYQALIPESAFGRTLSGLFCLLFLFLPFQHKHRGFLKGVLKKIYPSGSTFPPAFSKTLTIEPTDLLILIITCLLFFKFRVSLYRFFIEGPSKYLSFFLGACVLSLGISEWRGYVFQYAWFLKFLLAACVFYCIRLSFNGPFFKKWFLSFAWIFFITSIFVGFIGIAQYFIQGKVGCRWLGESSNAFFYFKNPSCARWLFDQLLITNWNKSILLRSCSTFYHPNPFGAFLFFSSCLTFYLSFIETRKNVQILLLTGVFFQIFALATTYSRSAILALIVSTLLLFILERKRERKKLIQLALTLLFSSLICLGLFFSQLFARGGLINYNVTVQGADQERILYQKVAVEMGKENPLLGVGFNSFQLHLAKYHQQGNSLFYKVHNIYLLIFSETGIVGIICFFLFLIACLKNVFFINQGLEQRILLSLTFGVLLIGGCDMFLLENSKLRIAFFALLGLLSLCPSRREQRVQN